MMNLLIAMSYKVDIFIILFIISQIKSVDIAIESINNYM